MSAAMLDQIRVIDAASGLAGSVAALLMAEAGAEVIKLEPPQGDSKRGTAAYAAWNRSKYSIALDVQSEQDRAKIATLLAGADVLIYEPGFPVALLESAPHLITSCLRPVPEGMEDQAQVADDFLVMAQYGFLDEQPATNRDGPAFIRLPFGSWCAAWLAVVGVMARCVHQQRGGAAGPADTSILQGLLVPAMMLWRQAERPTRGLEGRIDKRVLPSLFECGDHVWLHIMKNADDTPLMKSLLEAMGPEQVAQANAEWPSHFRYVNWGANVRAFKSRPSAEWLADLWASDIPVQPALPMGTLYEDAQAQANHYVVTLDDPDLGVIQQPGFPISMTPPAQVRGPAPRLNQHHDWALQRPVPARAAASPVQKNQPLLAGIKVVDFGNYLAGPLSTMLLADLGATVIKVEPPTGDPMRGNESAFLGCQRGKRSIALDLAHPDAQPVIARLVQDADIVHHNIRLPTAQKFGLSYAHLKAIKNDIIFGHVSAYGPQGPRRFWPGYDQLFQATTGWELAHAGQGNRPAWLRFGMMDHMCAMSLAYGMLLALFRRARTGEGGQVASSLLGASMLTMSEVARRADGSLTPWPATLDSAQTGLSAGRRLVACADGWIAISGPDDVAPPAEDLALLTCEAAIARAQAAGMLAVQCREKGGPLYMDNPRHAALGMVVEYPHPVYGTLRHPGGFWSLGETPLSLHRAPPAMGQHSEEILSEIGFSRSEMDALINNRVVICSEKERAHAS